MESPRKPVNEQSDTATRAGREEYSPLLDAAITLISLLIALILGDFGQMKIHKQTFVVKTTTTIL